MSWATPSISATAGTPPVSCTTARSVKEVDRKSNQFCRYCAVLLEDEMKRLAKGIRQP